MTGESDSGHYTKALLNILDDASAEKLQLEATQRAVLNVLEDSSEEKNRLADIQKAMLNILADGDTEKLQLQATQKAVLNMLEDIDGEKKKAEQANILTDAANKELEAFSYSVAHDLRAPLRGIDGFSQALLEDCADQLSAEGKSYLQSVRHSTQHMADLIDDLLALSRISRSELQRERVNLVAIAHDVLTRLQNAHPERTVELIIPTEIVAFGDARLLTIVFENLFDNAWKFTSKCPQARIELGRHVDDGLTIYYVRDNGAGFDMAYVQKLFGVFQRLHSVKEFEGTGIGLVTVRRIIQRHGGHIWAEGKIDHGATFYFTLGDKNSHYKEGGMP